MDGVDIHKNCDEREEKLQAENEKLSADLTAANLQNEQLRRLINEGDACCKCEPDTHGVTIKTCPLHLQVEGLQKKLAQIESAVCLNCKGSGEFGLADGEVPCWVCGGSGDPTKPGVFAEKPNDECAIWCDDPEHQKKHDFSKWPEPRTCELCRLRIVGHQHVAVEKPKSDSLENFIEGIPDTDQIEKRLRTKEDAQKPCPKCGAPLNAHAYGCL